MPLWNRRNKCLSTRNWRWLPNWMLRSNSSSKKWQQLLQLPSLLLISLKKSKTSWKTCRISQHLKYRKKLPRLSPNKNLNQQSLKQTILIQLSTRKLWSIQRIKSPLSLESLANLKRTKMIPAFQRSMSRQGTQMIQIQKFHRFMKRLWDMQRSSLPNLVNPFYLDSQLKNRRKMTKIPAYQRSTSKPEMPVILTLVFHLFMKRPWSILWVKPNKINLIRTSKISKINKILKMTQVTRMLLRLRLLTKLIKYH